MAYTPRHITRALDRVLHKVEQPARYTGGELNSIPKEWAEPTIRTKVALAFPDIYELGGSNLGLQVLYDRINRRPDLLAERVFCPWPDFEFYLRRDSIPLYGLETRHPLGDFDIVGFSLPYEQLYTNVLTMLDLGGFPLRAADRTAEHPLIIAGGSGLLQPRTHERLFRCHGRRRGRRGDLRGDRRLRRMEASAPPHARSELLGAPGAHPRRICAHPLRRELRRRRHNRRCDTQRTPLPRTRCSSAW